VAAVGAALLSEIYPLRYRPCPRNSWISSRLFFFFFFFFPRSSPPLSLSASLPFSLPFILSPQRGSRVRSLTGSPSLRSYRLTVDISDSRAFLHAWSLPRFEAHAFFFYMLPSVPVPGTLDYTSHFFLAVSRIGKEILSFCYSNVIIFLFIINNEHSL